jgi:hypothetical protein
MSYFPTMLPSGRYRSPKMALSVILACFPCLGQYCNQFHQNACRSLHKLLNFLKAARYCLDHVWTFHISTYSNLALESSVIQYFIKTSYISQSCKFAWKGFWKCTPHPLCMFIMQNNDAVLLYVAWWTLLWPKIFQLGHKLQDIDLPKWPQTLISPLLPTK